MSEEQDRRTDGGQLWLPGLEELAADVEGVGWEEAQAISVAAREAFEVVLVDPERGEVGALREEYERLCAGGWRWRHALYVAWAKLPKRARWPATQGELAEVMGLASDRTIRKWRERNPGIDLLVSQGVAGRVSERTAEVLSRAFEVAMGEGYKGHNDRKMLLEIEGVYRPKADVVVVGGVNSDEMARKAEGAREAVGEWERERFGPSESSPPAPPVQNTGGEKTGAAEGQEGR